MLVKPSLSEVDPLIANAVRLPAAFLVLVGLSSARGARPAPSRSAAAPVLMLALAGAFSGRLGRALAARRPLAGAAKSAALSSTAPIFAAPLAASSSASGCRPRSAPAPS